MQWLTVAFEFTTTFLNRYPTCKIERSTVFRTQSPNRYSCAEQGQPLAQDLLTRYREDVHQGSLQQEPNQENCINQLDKLLAQLPSYAADVHKCGV